MNELLEQKRDSNGSQRETANEDCRPVFVTQLAHRRGGLVHYYGL